jgi:hypothetical protein
MNQLLVVFIMEWVITNEIRGKMVPSDHHYLSPEDGGSPNPRKTVHTRKLAPTRI